MDTLHAPLARVSDISKNKWVRRGLVAAIIILFLVHRVFLTPDALFVILFLVSAVYGLGFQFVKMFSPFMVLLLSYDGLRGFVPYVSKHVHFSTMIDFDRWIGGGALPTVHLQRLLYHGHLNWYDFYFYGLYMMHFVVPLLLAVLIWRKRPAYYWQVVWTFVTLSYAGFITFLLFPAAPPWLAAVKGYIAPIEKLSTDIWFAMGVQNFPSLYEKFSPNQVAAVPSLHSAYPMVVSLFVFKLFGLKKGLISMIYPISIWIGVVYMGEHYVFDVIAGATYAIVSFFAVDWAMARFRARRSKTSASVAAAKPQAA